MGASIFNDIINNNSKIIESKISIYKWTNSIGYEIRNWIKIENYGWIDIIIENKEITKKLKENNIETCELSLDEFKKIMNN